MIRNAVIMAGGRGLRFGGVVKPLIKLCGKPLIDWVIRNVLGVAEYVVVAASPITEAVCRHVRSFWGPSVECVELPGSGYSIDVWMAARMVNPPVLITPSDTPLMDSSVLRGFIDEAMRCEGDVVTLEVRGYGPLGVSLIKGYGWSWSSVMVNPSPNLLNVNTFDDLRSAEVIACREG